MGYRIRSHLGGVPVTSHVEYGIEIFKHPWGCKCEKCEQFEKDVDSHVESLTPEEAKDEAHSMICGCGTSRQECEALCRENGLEQWDEGA